MMASAEWYCHDCDTHGGGPPNNMTPAEHVDVQHDGYAARIESV